MIEQIENWIAADNDGKIFMYSEFPERWSGEYVFESGSQYCLISSELCQKLIGKVLTWEDEPVKVE